MLVDCHSHVELQLVLVLAHLGALLFFLLLLFVVRETARRWQVANPKLPQPLERRAGRHKRQRVPDEQQAVAGLEDQRWL